MAEDAPLLTCTNLQKWFYANNQDFCAVDDVSFTVGTGESLGIVGESGSGKSTIAKMITLFERPDAGDITLQGHGSIVGARGKKRREVYRTVQMVFQNPMDSFDPHLTIGQTLQETAVNFGADKAQAQARVAEVLQMVGLKPELAKRYRQELSGGECQRAAIARALIASPKLLICDEITSALDVSVQAQILELVHDLHVNQHLSLLVISHDLAVVNLLCSRVLVLRSGQVVESGVAEEVLTHPQHPYTQLLVAAAAKAAGRQPDAPTSQASAVAAGESEGC